jgi:hypothetical protein
MTVCLGEDKPLLHLDENQPNKQYFDGNVTVLAKSYCLRNEAAYEPIFNYH